MLDETERMAAEHGDGLGWLLDMGGINKTTSQGRKILAIASDHASIRKHAMVGASTFIKTVPTSFWQPQVRRTG